VAASSESRPIYSTFMKLWNNCRLLGRTVVILASASLSPQSFLMNPLSLFHCAKTTRILPLMPMYVHVVLTGSFSLKNALGPTNISIFFSMECVSFLFFCWEKKRLFRRCTGRVVFSWLASLKGLHVEAKEILLKNIWRCVCESPPHWKYSVEYVRLLSN